MCGMLTGPAAGGAEPETALAADERIAAAGLGGALKDTKDKTRQIELVADFIAPVSFYPE